MTHDPSPDVSLQMVEFARGASPAVRMFILELLYGWDDAMQLPDDLAPKAVTAIRALAHESGMDLEGPRRPEWWTFEPDAWERFQALSASLTLDGAPEARRRELPRRVRCTLFLQLLNSEQLSPGQDLWMREQLNGDLSFLNVERLFDWNYMHVAQRYPDTRFTRACREYGRLRGGNYFWEWAERRSWHPRLLANRNQEAGDWLDWIRRYPDHPGADDATFWAARNLEWSGRRGEALELLANQLVAPLGDSDVLHVTRVRFLVLLDVGTTRAELEAFPKAHPLAPLARYASAVRLAREHRYAEALERSRGLSVMQTSVLALGNDFYPLSARVDEQRQRWADLARQPSRWQRASNWAAEDGWKNGYLELFRGHRAWELTYRWLDRVQPGPELRVDRALIRRNYQLASHNAVALELLDQVLKDCHTPKDIQERACYLRVALLYFQDHEYPVGETLAMHPLWGSNRDLSAWYTDEATRATRELLRRFPNSRYGDDALLVLWHMTGDSKYCEEARRRFPNGDLVQGLPGSNQ